MANTGGPLGKTATLPFFGTVLLLIGFFLPWFNLAPLLDDPAFILEATTPVAQYYDFSSLAADPRAGLNEVGASFGITTPIPDQFRPQQIIAYAGEIENAVNNPPLLMRAALAAAGQLPQLPERAWMLNILWIIPATAGLGFALCLIGRRPRVTPLPGAMLAVLVIVGVLVSGATYQSPTGIAVLGWDRMFAVQGVGAWISLVGGVIVLIGSLRRGHGTVA